MPHRSCQVKKKNRQIKTKGLEKSKYHNKPRPETQLRVKLCNIVQQKGE